MLDNKGDDEDDEYDEKLECACVARSSTDRHY